MEMTLSIILMINHSLITKHRWLKDKGFASKDPQNSKQLLIQPIFSELGIKMQSKKVLKTKKRDLFNNLKKTSRNLKKSFGLLKSQQLRITTQET